MFDTLINVISALFLLYIFGTIISLFSGFSAPGSTDTRNNSNFAAILMEPYDSPAFQAALEQIGFKCAIHL